MTGKLIDCRPILRENALSVLLRANDKDVILGLRSYVYGVFDSFRRNGVTLGYFDILKNEKYIGVYEFGDIRDENGIPAIIDRELFNKVQKMVEKHHRAPAAKKDNGDFCSQQNCSAAIAVSR